MDIIAYLNGEFLPLAEAKVSPMDRGFLMGDGIYEAIVVHDGVPFRLHEHLERLAQGLAAIELSVSMQHEDWVALLDELIKKNAAQGSYLRIHLQVTRGITPLPRTPHFPPNPEPTIFAYARAMRYASIDTLSAGFSAITAEDTRWQHCCIKATSLLPNVLHLQAAKAAGATDVILMRHGFITECACSNVFMVKNGVITTPPLSRDILGGVTRDYVMELATRMGLNPQEQPITPTELAQADEIWITSSSKPIYPIIQLDGKKVGQGQAGSVWRQLITQYMKEQQIPTHS